MNFELRIFKREYSRAQIAIATTPEEIKKLGQAGFIKYDEMKGMHFYRKPKKYAVYS